MGAKKYLFALVATGMFAVPPAVGDVLAEQVWNGDIDGSIFNYMSPTQIPWETLYIESGDPNVIVGEFFTTAFWRKDDGLNCLRDMVVEVRTDLAGKPDLSAGGLLVSVAVNTDDIVWNELGASSNGGEVVELTWSIPEADQFELPGFTKLWLSYYVPSGSPGFFGGMRATYYDNHFYRQYYDDLQDWSADVVYRLSSGTGGGLELMMSGTCPGQMTFDVTGASLLGQVALVYGFGGGPTIVPDGFPCAGTELDVGNPRLDYRVIQADTNGDASLTTNVPAAACDRVKVQALDLDSCETSNVVSP